MEVIDIMIMVMVILGLLSMNYFVFYSTHVDMNECEANDGDIIYRLRFDQFLNMINDKKYNWDRKYEYPKSFIDYINGGYIHAGIIKFDNKVFIMKYGPDYWKYQMFLYKNRVKRSTKFVDYY